MYFTLFLALLVLNLTSLVLKLSQASEIQSVDFEVLASGDLSGYTEETYLVIWTESEWEEVWEKHSLPYEHKGPSPEIIFSRNMVICVFLGKRLTTGYEVSVDRIWDGDEIMPVEITKHNPPKHAVVGEVLTYPFIFVSLKTRDLEVL